MIKRMTWFVGGAVAGVAGLSVAKRKMKQAATHLTPKHIVHGISDRVHDAFSEGRRRIISTTATKCWSTVGLSNPAKSLCSSRSVIELATRVAGGHDRHAHRRARGGAFA